MSFRFSPTSRAVLRSLVPVICPPEAQPYADDIVDHMELTLGSSAALVRRAFEAGLATYDYGALPFHRRRARDLSPERAERYYASWEHGPTPVQVQLARALNQIMSMACYEQPAMMERVGYRVGPWIEEVTRKRLTVHRDAIRAQDERILAPDPLRPGVRVRSAMRKAGS